MVVAMPLAARRRSILGADLDLLTLEETVEECTRLVRSGGAHHQVSMNAAKVVRLREDGELRRACDRASLVTADGMSVVWAGRLLGLRVPERVAGIDLMAALLDRAERDGLRVFFLGARRDIVETVVEVEKARHPRLQVAGLRDGYWTPEEEEAVVGAIAETRPDILFVALPTPRKELFVDRHLEALGTKLVVGVGGSFDVVAGLVTRAPMWMQRAGLEWFHRLVCEPRKMWKRYLVGNSRFIALVAAAMLTQSRDS